MKDVDIKNKRIAKERLTLFGFRQDEQGYTYVEPIMDGQFVLNLAVRGGALFSSLTESAFGDEYILHLVPGAQGEFVGKIRAAYGAVLDRFIEQCCENDIFRREQTCAVIDYARLTYGNEPEYLWKKFSDNAVLRRKDTRTWYAVLLTVSRDKLGFDSDETVEVIDLRMPPESATEFIDGKRFLPGYHMNKKHWFTIVLDGSGPTEEILKLIDVSYELANKKAKRAKK